MTVDTETVLWAGGFMLTAIGALFWRAFTSVQDKLEEQDKCRVENEKKTVVLETGFRNLFEGFNALTVEIRDFVSKDELKVTFATKEEFNAYQKELRDKYSELNTAVQLVLDRQKRSKDA